MNGETSKQSRRQKLKERSEIQANPAAAFVPHSTAGVSA
jgi:hypothetical protein